LSYIPNSNTVLRTGISDYALRVGSVKRPRLQGGVPANQSKCYCASLNVLQVWRTLIRSWRIHSS